MGGGGGDKELFTVHVIFIILSDDSVAQWFMQGVPFREDI